MNFFRRIYWKYRWKKMETMEKCFRGKGKKIYPKPKIFHLFRYRFYIYLFDSIANLHVHYAHMQCIHEFQHNYLLQYLMMNIRFWYYSIISVIHSLSYMYLVCNLLKTYIYYSNFNSIHIHRKSVNHLFHLIFFYFLFQFYLSHFDCNIETGSSNRKDQ